MNKEKILTKLENIVGKESLFSWLNAPHQELDFMSINQLLEKEDYKKLNSFLKDLENRFK